MAGVMETKEGQKEVEIIAAAEEKEPTDVKYSSPDQPIISCFGSFHKYKNFFFNSMFLPAVKVMEREFQPRSDDIFMASLPKTGTTWCKALLHTMLEFTARSVHSRTNDVDEKNPHALVPTMESFLFNKSIDEQYYISVFSVFPSPRLLHTHLPFDLLPAPVRSSPDCKIVYIARNPRDTFVSLWKFCNKLHELGFRYADGDFTKETVFDAFCSGFFRGGPFAESVLSYWQESRRNPNKVLFLTYEDLQADCVGCVKRIGAFLGCSPRIIEENAERIVDNCSFDYLSNLEVNIKGKVEIRKYPVSNSVFFREGKVGEWKKHFTPQMEDRIYLEIEQKLSQEGLHFINCL